MASNGQSEPADSSRPTPCPCRLKSSAVFGVTIFVSLFLCIPFAAWRADSAAFSWKLFEVYMWQNIMMWFLLFSLFTPVFYYGAKTGSNLLAGPLTAFALWQTANYFYAYGWLSFIPAQTAAALKFWPACVGDKCGAAQMLRDIVFEYHRPGEQQLIEDAAWCAITGVIFIAVETGRWSLTLPYTSIPATVLAPFVPLFGYDLVLPAFILILWSAETSGRAPKPSRDLRYVYLVVCVLALVLWIPHFYAVSWEIWTGRFYKVPQNAFGLRAFWSVYGYAFTLAFYIVPDTNMVTASGPVGAVTGWVVRVLYIWFMCSSIVGAWLCMLYFREITPNRSFKIARNIPSVNGNPNPFEGDEYMGTPVLKRD